VFIIYIIIYNCACYTIVKQNKMEKTNLTFYYYYDRTDEACVSLTSFFMYYVFNGRLNTE